ncbi:MAG TPA: cyclic pyranopterin monophosphate synthase MoaC [Candidatus Sulfotelmatobacter sp.]|nr:cyclic pyranopterin monophosphate synthase MoaC [Candidatus Sulfotelmatobacter sp.]
MTLSHLDNAGRPRMVDVSTKAETRREATARGQVRCHAQALALMREQAAPKGDVLTVAQLAGIMAAKQTAQLIPLCHPLPLTHIDVELRADDGIPGVDITATVRTNAATGVEMEALTAVSVAALTVIDMIKSADPWATVCDVGVLRKSGGRSGERIRPGRG